MPHLQFAFCVFCFGWFSLSLCLAVSSCHIFYIIALVLECPFCTSASCIWLPVTLWHCSHNIFDMSIVWFVASNTMTLFSQYIRYEYWCVIAVWLKKEKGTWNTNTLFGVLVVSLITSCKVGCECTCNTVGPRCAAAELELTVMPGLTSSRNWYDTLS